MITIGILGFVLGFTLSSILSASSKATLEEYYITEIEQLKKQKFVGDPQTLDDDITMDNIMDAMNEK